MIKYAKRRQLVWYAQNQGRKRLKHRKRDSYAPDVFPPLSEQVRPYKRNKHGQTGKKKRNKIDPGRTRLNIALDEKELVASICRDSFFEFVKEFWDEVVAEAPVWNWHIKYLCDELQEMCERIFAGKKKIYDLVVNIAPGTTKSLIMSVMLPAWCWTRMPNFKFIGASYSGGLSMDLSIKTRDIVISDKYKEAFPYVQLREDQNTKTYFKTTKKGYRYSVGVNGSVTGMHGHLIVIDDPLNPQEAMSALEINSANHWIKHSLSNRKVDKAISAIVLVMQRLHQDDPTAMMIKNKRVRHLCLPAEIEPGVQCNVYPEELVDFYTDGLMDPVRMDHEVLKDEKAKGEYYYSAQFRQDPVPAGGGMFKTKRLKAEPVPDYSEFLRFVRYWDKAGTKDGGTYTVGTKIGLDRKGRFWVLDVIRVQLDSFEREALIERTAELDGYETLIGVEQEPGSGGKESAESSVKRLAGFKVVVQKVDAQTGGKVQRADPWSVQMNAGNVYLPVIEKDDTGGSQNGWSNESWSHEWVEEHRYFPYSKFKDQVDSASGAFSLCQRHRVRIGALDPSEAYQGQIQLNQPKRKSPRSAYWSKKDKEAALGV